MYFLLAAKFTMPRSPKGADHFVIDPSLISRFTQCLSFPRRVEHALDVPVRCPHDTDAGEHRRPAERCHQHLFSEPSFRFSRGPKRSPSQHFARVRRARVVEGLSCYLPMRFVSIGKPRVHHERISVVGAFNPIGARLWFQSHRDKSHFPNCPMVAKKLRLEGTSALRSGRLRRIPPGTQSRCSGFVPRGTQSLPPASPRDSFSALAGV